MSHVPNYAVVWSVEYIVQGHGQFHGSHARPKMSRIMGKSIDNEMPDFVTHLG